MQLAIYLGLALFALFITLAFPLAHKEHWVVMRESWRLPLRVALRQFMLDELGAVTVTYYDRGGVARINGSTTAPTASQASELQKQSALVVFGVTADAQALFTHNWGLDASAPGYFEPELLMVEPQSVTTYFPLLTFDRTNTNVFKINKPATDAPTTVLITLRRPHSMGQ
jgi:hypothetical protein